MADRLANSLFADRDPRLSQTLLDHVQDHDIGPALFDNAAMRSGAVQTAVVFTMYPENLPGQFVPSFFNDWYNRIHFIPTKLDLGNLLSDQSRDVILWNAFLVSKTIDSFAIGNADGITITPPEDVPYTALPLSQSKYVVTIKTDGPPNINATMTWTIGGIEQQYSLPITGRRTIIWSIAPNWSSPVDETLEWLTHVETAFDGTEQRFAAREVPRRVLEYTAQAVGVHTQLFENLMFGWSDRYYAVPLWHEKANLLADVAPGDTVLSVATDDRTFTAGGLLAIFASPLSYEAIEIEAVSAGSVTLKKGVEYTWPKGTRVYPIMIARLEQNTSASYVAEDKLEAAVRFTGSPMETDPRIPVIAPAVTEGGVEVFTEGTNWGTPVSVDFTGSYNVIDSDRGALVLRQRAGWPQVVKGHEWLLRSAAEASALRAFFGRRRGRQVPAWIPTGTVDFTLAEPAVLTDTVLTVRNNDYGQLVNKHPARRHVLIQLRGGTNILRQIDNYADNGDGTALISLATQVGIAIDPSQVRRISYIGLYRMASDAVTFSWKTTGVAVVQTAFALTKPSP